MVILFTVLLVGSTTSVWCTRCRHRAAAHWTRSVQWRSTRVTCPPANSCTRTTRCTRGCAPLHIYVSDDFDQSHTVLVLWIVLYSTNVRCESRVQVLTSSGDSTCGLWDVESGTQIECFRGHLGDVICLDCPPSDVGNLFISGVRTHSHIGQ